jgi:hypothetical protein
MESINWSGCPLVEVIPGKVSRAPLLKSKRLPVVTRSKPFCVIAPSMNFKQRLAGRPFAVLVMSAMKPDATQAAVRTSTQPQKK